ncbi:MAG: hypothetical protein RDU30_04805 [Desulfovibrionaceae bacterium]|nr:hypothetical protein [Desulfovibrionaceae bacterium]
MKYSKFHKSFHDGFTLAIADASRKVANIYYKLFLKCAPRMNKSLPVETRLNLYFQLSEYMTNTTAKKLSHMLFVDLKRINRGRKAIFCARVNTSLDIQFQKALTTSVSDIKRILDACIGCQGSSSAKLTIYHGFLNRANNAFEKVYAKTREDLYAFIAGNLNAIVMMLDESNHEIRNVLGRFLIFPVEIKHGISTTDEADTGFFPRRYCKPVLAVLEASIIGEDTYQTVNNKLIEYIENRLGDTSITKDGIAFIYKTTDIAPRIEKYVEKVYERFEGQQRRLDFVAAVNEHLRRNGPPGPEFTYSHLQLVLAAWYDFFHTGR